MECRRCKTEVFSLFFLLLREEERPNYPHPLSFHAKLYPTTPLFLCSGTIPPYPNPFYFPGKKKKKTAVSRWKKLGKNHCVWHEHFFPVYSCDSCQSFLLFFYRFPLHCLGGKSPLPNYAIRIETKIIYRFRFESDFCHVWESPEYECVFSLRPPKKSQRLGTQKPNGLLRYQFFGRP